VKQKEHDCLVLQVEREQELWESRRHELESDLLALRQSAKEEMIQL
jgi:hypothetical protein